MSPRGSNSRDRAASTAKCLQKWSSGRPVLWRVLGASHIRRWPDRASKVKLQSANKGTLDCLRLGTEMHCVLPRASGATGRMGHVLFRGGHRYFLARSSGQRYTWAGDYTQNSFMCELTRPWNCSTAAISSSFPSCASFKMSLLILGWKIGLEELDSLTLRILRCRGYTCWKYSLCKTRGERFPLISIPFLS